MEAFCCQKLVQENSGCPPSTRTQAIRWSKALGSVNNGEW